MTTSYMPRSQADAQQFMRAFVNVLAANPGAFMLVQADVDALNLAVSRYEAALEVATTKATRTESAVSAKDQTRNAAEQIVRQYYSMIKPNAGISDDAKIEAGIRPINRGRTSIYCPQTSPFLKIIAATPGRHTLRYSDSMTPTSPGKPFGAVHLQLFRGITDRENIEDVAQTTLYGCFTRNPVTVDFDSKDDGRKATYFGRWVSRRGDVGPWSVARSLSIAA